MPPKIAYFIMVHHKPAQFDWLLRAIHDPSDLFLVHVDTKSRLGLKRDRQGVMAGVRAAVAGKPGVRLMRSRFTNWGGWSLSRILLDAIRLALKNPDWQWFVNLSGQCYPLRSMAAIKGELAGDDRVRVQMWPIADRPADDWHHRQHPMLETPFKAIILPGRKPPPAGFTMANKGSQWVMVPRAFCEWLVAAPVTQTIAAYMRGLLLTDELIVQTLVANGPFADRIATDYGREIVWPGPRTFTLDDWPMLQASPALFARKFDAARDPALMAALADANGFPRGPLVTP